MSDLKVQISFTLKGADAHAFFNYKSASFLSADAEVARQLILQRLAQIQHDTLPGATRRKSSVRASSSSLADAVRKEKAA